MTQDFISFMSECTTAYQTVHVVKEKLLAAGYQELSEKENWQLESGKGYFVTRNDSSILAFEMPKGSYAGFHMVCAHSDSPALKLKEQPDMKQEGYYKLNVEKYGGMIMDTWFDRPLSLAGRIVVDESKKEEKPQLRSVLVDLKKPLFIIPSLAIHMTDRSGEKKISVQQNLLPIAGMEPDSEDILAYIADQAHVKKEDILGMDLYFYTAQKPQVLGMRDELIAGARMDDIACVYCGLKALLEMGESEHVKVLGIFDNEEVGSSTMQGAQSDFLLTTLRRICPQNLEAKLAESFLISADNGHAVHPNYASKADPTNKPVLNGGIVIKYHGGQKYTTSAFSGAYVKAICSKEGIAYQTYQNHSDVLGGSTLGNILTQSVSVPAADIGLAQLAMHSAYETIGTKDIHEMIRFMHAFF